MADAMTEKKPIDKPFIIKLRAFAYVATLLRFNLFILLAGTVLLFVDQGQDLLRMASEYDSAGVMFGGGLLWAWSLWYWARVLLEIRFPNPPVPRTELAWWCKHLPRILGLLAFLALAWNLYRAIGPDIYVGLMVLAGFSFFVWLIYRRDIRQWLAEWFSEGGMLRRRLWVEKAAHHEEREVKGRWHDDFLEAWSLPMVKVISVLGVVMFVWGLICPLSMGDLFTGNLKSSSLLLLFLWGATFLAFGSVITYVGNRNGIPLFGIIFACALIFSLWNDNHAIRTLDSKFEPPQERLPARPKIEDALGEWVKKNNCGKDACPPLVVVATAGGGIRAAYWTGTVLGRLDDKTNKELRKYLFAISGVSGGSVGAAVYRAMMDVDPTEGQMETMVQNVLAKDFLTPLSVGILYPDFVQRFLPTYGSWTLRDRASIFEQSMERGFRDVMQQAGKSDKPGLDRSFIGLTSRKEKSWPALFLNATWAENGRRIVAAGYDMRDQQRQPRWYAADEIDFLQHDLRLSTAAHNSARFPYVSPPGSWNLNTGDAPLLQRIQDGGLFENFGAETAMEILQVARAYFEREKLHFNPMVILISSDPKLPGDLKDFQFNNPANFSYEVLTTPRTFEAVRNGRADEAAAQLKELTRNIPNSQFAYFRMCRGGVRENPPLGWALSKKARDEIEGYLPKNPLSSSWLGDDCRRENSGHLNKVLGAIPGNRS